MHSTALVLLSFTYLVSATDEGSAFGDDAPVMAPKRSRLTLRKPTPTYEESESAFGDVDFSNDASENKREKQPELAKKPASMHEESAFGDVDYLRDVVEDVHVAPSKPALRKKSTPENEESAFGDGMPGNKGDSSEAGGLQKLDETQSLIEESELGGELTDDAEDNLDDKDLKKESEQELNPMWNTKSGFTEGDEAAVGGEEHEHRSEEVRASEKKCTGSQCDAEKWSPVRNVHAYGPSGKPANWKPRRIIGNGKDLMADETPRERGPRIYSRHQAVEHQAPAKRSLGEFMSSFLER